MQLICVYCSLTLASHYYLRVLSKSVCWVRRLLASQPVPRNSLKVSLSASRLNNIISMVLSTGDGQIAIICFISD